jgi:tetratricopeptide (TPR) repeat protein
MASSPKPALPAVAEKNNEDEPKKLFLTTTDLLNTMNHALSKMDEEGIQPRFELQKRLPNGNTAKCSEQDMAVADMESKFKQAAGEVEELNDEQKLEWAKIQRKEGNVLYARKEYKEAIDVYLTCLVVKSPDENITTDFMDQVYLPVLNNLAQCTLQLGSYRKAATFCTMALEEEPKLLHRPEAVSKLYFRRGKARRLGGDYKEAIEDFAKAQELLGAPADNEAEHRAIKKELQLVEQSLIEGRRNEAKQKDAMKRFFDAPAADALGGGMAPNKDQHATTMPTANRSAAGNNKKSEPSLYGAKKRAYSTLRAKKEVDDDDKEPKELSHWQYYLAVIGSIAERLLIMMGDEETIQKEQARLYKED